jgi:hypothetical protein
MPGCKQSKVVLTVCKGSEAMSGLCIITNCDLKENDIIEVCINTLNSNLIYARCTVKWLLNRGPKKVYGLSITHIDDKNKFLLSGLIDELEMTERNRIKQLMESKPEQFF